MLTFVDVENKNDVRFDVVCLSEFDFHSDEYLDLYYRSGATAFQHPVWLSNLYNGLAPSRGAEAAIIVGRFERDNKLAFVLPMVSRKIYGIRLIETADLGVTDYSAPVVDKDIVQPSNQYSVLRAQVAAALGQYNMLRIKAIREDQRFVWSPFFDGETIATDFSCHASSSIGGDIASWRDRTYSKSYSRTVKRKKRKLEKLGDVKLEIVEQDDLPSAMEFIRDRRLGRFEGDPIQNDPVFAFYSAIAHEGLTNGFARTYRLSCDEQTVGVLFGVVKDDAYHYLLIGCDYDRFGVCSPGLVMYDLIMDNCYQEDLPIFDFTIGDEAYKFSYNVQSVKMFQLHQPQDWLGHLFKKAFEIKKLYLPILLSIWRRK